jgi:hypothetical protein
VDLEFYSKKTSSSALKSLCHWILIESPCPPQNLLVRILTCLFSLSLSSLDVNDLSGVSPVVDGRRCPPGNGLGFRGLLTMERDEMRWIGLAPLGYSVALPGLSLGCCGGGSALLSTLLRLLRTWGFLGFESLLCPIDCS